MTLLKEITAVTAVALQAIPRRLGTSLIVVVGTATTVAVFLAALALATGFTRAAAKLGSPDRAIVLGGLTEESSQISRSNAATIVDAPGIIHTATGAPIASAEALVSIPLTDTHTGRDAYITVRGVGSEALALRPGMHIVSGRLFEPGRREVIVGRALQERLGGLAIGSHIALRDGDWTVVGLFSSGADVLDSEVLTDASTLMNDLHLRAFNTVTVRLTSPRAFHRFRAALASIPSLSVNVQREDEYYATVSRPISRLLKFTAYGLGTIMSFGALFGALNTMFSAVRARRTEIATLRAIGFERTAVIASVLVEALVLCLGGALLGATASWLLLDRATITTMVATGTLLHLTFGLDIGTRIVLVGVLFALGIAAVGGAFAAVQASRVSISGGMRET